MNIALTGSNGFVGSFLADCLRQAGNSIFPLTSKINMNLGFGDCEYDGTQYLVDTRIESVIHCGAKIPKLELHENANDFITSNLLRTVSLAEWSIKNRIPVFIFISTVHIDDYLLRNKASNHTSAFSPTLRYYFMSKLLAEIYLKDLFHSSESRLSILRIGTPISEAFCSSNLIKRLVDACIHEQPVQITAERQEAINLTWLPDLFILINELISGHRCVIGEVLSSSTDIASLVLAVENYIGRDLKIKYTNVSTEKKFGIRHFNNVDSVSFERTELSNILSAFIRNRIEHT